MTEDPSSTDAAAAAQQSSRLAEIMAATTQSLLAGFAELKASFSHNTSKGAGGEALVAQFLQKRLPEQIGATAGQVIDSTGQMSKQVDVVLYDRTRTPMLFTSPNGYDQLIPVEGVLAVVEVKTHLKKAMLPSILENCRSVKLLRRTAYLPRVVSPIYRMYDQDWNDFPIYYSVFAAKADGMYAGELNELQYDRLLYERIDSVCYLDRGTNLNVSLPDIYGNPQVSATSSAGSGLMDIKSEQALLHWYGALAGVISQAEVRPINILAYMAGEMQVSGTMPQGKVTDDLKARLLEEVSVAIGLDPEVLRRFQDQALTARDTYELFRAPGFHVAPEHEQAAQPLREAARAMSFEEWTAWLASIADGP